MNKIKIKKILKTYSKIIVKIILSILVLTTVFWAINEIIYGKIIWGNAQKAFTQKEYDSAILKYNYATKYYSKTKFIHNNLEKYTAAQYIKAICYLKIKDYKNADNSIKNGAFIITNTYGVNSNEYATYVRNNIIKYYIEKGDYKAAKEFLKLSEYFYLKLKSTKEELAEINNLYGNYYTAQNEEAYAIKYYELAYNLAKNYNHTKPALLLEISKNLTKTKIKMNDTNNLITINAFLLDNLKNNKKTTKEELTEAYWLLGKAHYVCNKPELAIGYYDYAYYLILKLSNNSVIKKDIDNLRTDMVKCYLTLGRHSTAEKMQKQIKMK